MIRNEIELLNAIAAALTDKDLEAINDIEYEVIQWLQLEETQNAQLALLAAAAKIIEETL